MNKWSLRNDGSLETEDYQKAGSKEIRWDLKARERQEPQARIQLGEEKVGTLIGEMGIRVSNNNC